jgi:hypothetical protein
MRQEDRQDDGAKPSRGDTVTAQGETQAPKGRMPHERDESADSQAAEAAPIARKGEQAHKDIEQGQPDTDKGPAMDEAYRKQKP